MITGVRTGTVGYKARVKNSLSFSTLPTKPFPRLKGTDRARREEQTAWEPRKNHAPEQTSFSAVVRCYLQHHRGVSLMPAMELFFFQCQITRVIDVPFLNQVIIDLRMETTKWEHLGLLWELYVSWDPDVLLQSVHCHVHCCNGQATQGSN